MASRVLAGEEQEGRASTSTDSGRSSGLSGNGDGDGGGSEDVNGDCEDNVAGGGENMKDVGEKRSRPSDDWNNSSISKKSSKSSGGSTSVSVAVSRISVADLAQRIGALLSLSPHLVNIARQACEKIQALGLLPPSVSSTPQCVAALVIFCMCHITGKGVDIAKITTSAESSVSVSIPHLTKTFTQLRPFIKTIFPKDFVIAEESGFNSLPLTFNVLLDT